MSAPTFPLPDDDDLLPTTDTEDVRDVTPTQLYLVLKPGSKREIHTHSPHDIHITVLPPPKPLIDKLGRALGLTAALFVGFPTVVLVAVVLIWCISKVLGDI